METIAILLILVAVAITIGTWWVNYNETKPNWKLVWSSYEEPLRLVPFTGDEWARDFCTYKIYTSKTKVKLVSKGRRAKAQPKYRTALKIKLLVESELAKNPQSNIEQIINDTFYRKEQRRT